MDKNDYIIPEIPPLKEEIIEAKNDEKLVIFVGAGVSRLTGCKGWQELANSLVEKCFTEKIISYKEKESLKLYKDPKKIITISQHLLKKQGKEEEFYEVMEESFRGHDLKKIYKKLFNLSNLCITTNADKMFHSYFADDRIVCSNFNEKEISNNRLYQIHGRIDKKNSLVFSVKEYLERYNRTDFKNFLNKIFTEYTILFIGYGLEELEVLDYVFTKVKRENRHYMLHPIYKDDINIFKFEKEYYNNFGIELLPYQKDKNGFHQLVNVLAKWEEEVKYKTDKIKQEYNNIENAITNGDISLLKQIWYGDLKKYLYKEICKSGFLVENVIECILDLDILKINEIPTCDEENRNDDWKELEVYDCIISKNMEKLTLNQIKKINSILKKLMNEILEKRIQNYRSNEIILKLVIMLKNKSFLLKEKKYFDYVLKNPGNQYLFGHYLENNIIPKLIKDKNVALLKYLIEECLGYKEEKRNIVSIIGDYYLKRVFVKNVEKIYDIIGINFLNILKNCISSASTEGKDYYNNFIIPEFQSFKNFYSYQEAIIDIFFKAIEILKKKNNVEKYREFIIELYKQENIKIFKRIGIYLMSKNIELFKEIVLNDLKKLLKNYEVENEIFYFLKENFKKFTQEDLEKIVKAVDEASKTPYEKKYWLEALKELNNELINSKYDEASKSYPKEIKNPGKMNVVRCGVYNPESPKSKDEIIYLIEHDLDNLFKVLKEYKNKKRFVIDEPSKDGLCKEIKEAVSINSDIFINSLEKFENVDKDYYYHIISGLIVVLNNKKVLNNLDKVLMSIKRKILYNYKEIFEEENKDWQLKYLIADFLEVSLKNLENISEDNLKLTLEIIKKSTSLLKVDEENIDNIENTYMYFLNSLNGRYYNALLQLLTISNHRKSNLKLEIIDLFNEKINKDVNVDICIASHLNLFMKVDSKWTTENLNKLFDFSKNKFIWEVLEGYLRINNPIYTDIYEKLEEKYNVLIEKYDEFKSEKCREALVNHSLIAFYYFENKEKQLSNLLKKDLEEIYLITLKFISNKEELDSKKSKKLWKIISNKIGLVEDKSQIVLLLFRSLINIKIISETEFNTLKKSIKYIKEYPYNILEVMKYLLEKNIKNEVYIADWLIEFCKNNIFFQEFEINILQEILDKIKNEEKIIEIKNRYIEIDKEFKL